MKRWLYILIGVLAVSVAVVWFFSQSPQTLPGQKFEDEGRDHVPVGTSVNYRTNPPTSGPHYENWTRPGVYDQPQEDGYLVHSLEHGYIVISYNCDKEAANGKSFESRKLGFSFVTYVYAQEASSSPSEATNSSGQNSDDCKQLVDQLRAVYENKGKRKIIVVPRPNLDTRIALTAWTYMDKFDQFDQERIERFIDAHRDFGPERTME